MLVMFYVCQGWVHIYEYLLNDLTNVIVTILLFFVNRSICINVIQS